MFRGKIMPVLPNPASQNLDLSNFAVREESKLNRVQSPPFGGNLSEKSVRTFWSRTHPSLILLTTNAENDND